MRALRHLSIVLLLSAWLGAAEDDPVEVHFGNVNEAQGLSFGQRNGGGRKLMVMRHGGGKTTEVSVEAALTWLAMHQEADGHWDSKRWGNSQKMDTQSTALALLTFLGAGHTEKIGKYKENVKRAVAWMQSIQAPDGLLQSGADEHSDSGLGPAHVLGGCALAEAAGLAKVPETVVAAQKALDFSSELLPDNPQPRALANTASAGWYVLLLRNARAAGLRVTDASFESAQRYFESVKRLVKLDGDPADPAVLQQIKNLNDEDFAAREAAGEALSALKERALPAMRAALKGDLEPEVRLRLNNLLGKYGNSDLFTYLSSPQDRSGAGRASSTAMALYSRYRADDDLNNLRAGVEGMIRNGGYPKWGAKDEAGDALYWHFGTLDVFMAGGEAWKRWNECLRREIVGNQRKEGDESGSWDPTGTPGVGRVEQTAIGALCLEVYYRYGLFGRP